MPPLKELDSAPELRDDPSLKDFNDVPSLAKALKETKAFVGGSIRPPGPGASEEAKKEFYAKLQQHAPDLVPLVENDPVAQAALWKRLGVPEKPEEYEYKPPEGVDFDVDSLRSVAKTAGLTKAQFKKIADTTAEGRLKANGEAVKDIEGLKKEWGAAYPDKLKAASSIAAKLNVPENVVKLIAAGQLSSTQLKIWDSIASAVGREPKENGSQGGQQRDGNLTPAEAELRFREIQANPAYLDRRDPRHALLVKQAAELAKFM